MKIYLHPNGWPASIEQAPFGLLVRERKGRVDLFFKTAPNSNSIAVEVFNMEGNPTTVTGKVTPVRLMKEEK